MEELSIEQKAKRYDEAIKRAKSKIKNDKDHVLYEGDVIEIFPELYESEDDRIKNEIIDYISTADDKVLIPYESWIAWLEKQGEQKANEIYPIFRVDDYIRNKKTGDKVLIEQLDVKLKAYCYTSYDGAAEIHSDFPFSKQDEWELIGQKIIEQKPFDYENANIQQKDFAPKAGPKFKVGDWVVLTVGELSDTLQIANININKELYWFTDGCVLPFADEENLHLWTIKDAKAGDVLCYNDDIIVIFKYFHDDSSFCSYCYIDSGVFFTTNDRTPVWWMNNVFYPATKEQSNILFAKMEESGYEWDETKKKLIHL